MMRATIVHTVCRLKQTHILKSSQKNCFLCVAFLFRLFHFLFVFLLSFLFVTDFSFPSLLFFPLFIMGRAYIRATPANKHTRRLFKAVGAGILIAALIAFSVASTLNVCFSLSFHFPLQSSPINHPSPPQNRETRKTLQSRRMQEQRQQQEQQQTRLTFRATTRRNVTTVSPRACT